MASVIPKVEVLSHRIVRVLGCNPGHMTLQGTNTYLVGSGPRRVLIDTGEESNTDYISSLQSVLKKHKAQISDVIITHWHGDHIGGLCDVLTSTNKDATVHKLPCLSPPDEPLPHWVNLQPLKHLQEITVEGATLRVHHTPGHTSDHVVLHIPDGDDCGVFTGDCILGEGTAVFEDLYDYMNSLKDLLVLSPSTLYPGHGPLITEGKSKIEEYINHRNIREKQILDTLSSLGLEGATPYQLVKIVYKEVPEHLHPAAEVNLRHHLSKLVKEGKVKEGEDGVFVSLTAANKL